MKEDYYYKCDDCGKHFKLDDTCFLGTIDRLKDEKCNPFMDLDCFCSDCVSKYETSDK